MNNPPNFHPLRLPPANLPQGFFLRVIRQSPLTVWHLATLLTNEDQAVEAAYTSGLIPMEIRCRRCQTMMKWRRHPPHKLGFQWVCHKRTCRLYVNPLRGTFFENVHLPFLTVWKLMYHFMMSDKVTYAAKMVQVTEKTAVDFYSFCREVYNVVQDHDATPIGGPDDVVEVDESHLFTPKYHRGRRMQRQMWVFGGVSRLTGKMFCEVIRNKERRTLFPIMRRSIRRRTVIMSDYHRSYLTCVARLGMKAHGRVNHSLGFTEGYLRLRGMRPRLGSAVAGRPGVRDIQVHSNTLERAWRELKKSLRTTRSADNVPGHIGAYLYNRNILMPLRTYVEQFARFI